MHYMFLKVKGWWGLLLPILTCAALKISALSVALTVRSYISVGERWGYVHIVSWLISIFINSQNILSYQSNTATLNIGVAIATCYYLYIE